MSNSNMEQLTNEQIQAELLRTFEEIQESRKRRKKIEAETVKIEKEGKYYLLSLLLGSAVIGACIALGASLLTAIYLK